MVDSGTESSVAQTILYLRPKRDETNEVLDIPENEPYVKEVAPPPEPTDIPLDGVSENPPTSHLSPHDLGHGSVSRETTPGLYLICPRAFRLGFDSIEKPSARGSTFGSGPDSNVKLPYYSKKSSDTNSDYFRIHYNFNSGALLITALDKIMVGSARLKEQHSLLLMAGMSIHCGGVFEFTVKFPDLSNCAEEHERNYQVYATQLGFPDAQYMATSREEDPPIGAEHRSKAILGKGTFGEVHKAVNTRTGAEFAIKILSKGGEQELKEVNIMSKLCHENIIKYERAFKLPGGLICIVMELAVNDLYTHLKARKNSKDRSYLSLQCIRSIGRQTLSGLEYLHSKGFTHRDLKPTNILVTDWDAGTDTPAIKLADFGLTGIGSDHKTYCGTDGYMAPEVIKAHQHAEELEKQKNTGMKTVTRKRRLMYTNAVDIWSLGKILQELVQHSSSRILLLRGKTVPGNKEPALRLVGQMMQNDAERRPTAAGCLMDPWMATNNRSDSLLGQKRHWSPTPSTSSPCAGQPLQKMIRKSFEGSNLTEDDLTTRITNATRPDERPEHQSGFSQASGDASTHDVEMKDCSVEEGLMSHDHPQATQLTIRLGKDGLLSLTAYSYNDALMLDSMEAQGQTYYPAIVVDNFDHQRGTSSMQDVVSKLLTAFQAEGYGNYVTVAGNSTDVAAVCSGLSRLSILNLQVRQESESSIMLGLEFEGEEWTGSFWNEVQSSVSLSIGRQPAGPADRNNLAATGDASRPRSFLQVMFSQARPLSLLDELWDHGEVPVGALAEFPVPSTTLDCDAISDKDLSATRGSVTSIGSKSSWSSEASRGVTYPSNLGSTGGIPTSHLLCTG